MIIDISWWRGKEEIEYEDLQQSDVKIRIRCKECFICNQIKTVQVKFQNEGSGAENYRSHSGQNHA
ncbi:hypothetical protein BV494_05215 [Rahnella sikkimica]|uniref:Uncharacterized protein n=1 Tax=Rahnella sikkimica TaxID=1805933 RepID=A0A2L1UN60_9GAMM|nr:hypothetical protein BV494_05215 [Rahnella sikkimica]